MSLMSRKCTVSAASSSASPVVNRNCTNDDHREPQQLERIERPLVVEQEGGEDRQAEEEVRQVRQHRDDWQHLGDSTFLIRLPPEMSTLAASTERRA